MTTYVAPACKVFTVAHVAADGAEVTDCGEEMPVADVWLEVDLKPGDRVCPACLGEPEDQQGSLL